MAASNTSHVKGLVLILKDPVVVACLQLTALLLVRALQELPHPAARIGRRVLIALTIFARARDGKDWLMGELKKLRTELRSTARDTPDSPTLTVAITLIDRLLSSLRKA